ncbi:MAG TPA: nucleoside triphosphate pyrophosphohydrolase [Spirochaetia bacterium]
MADTPASFQRLFGIIQRLRAPDGCPWDREQTPQSIRGNLIEEAWECIAAIDAGDDVNMEEELGDLYLIVTMMAWMKEQQGAFTVASTLEGISDKLIRRHPHVFGTAHASTPAEGIANWDRIKAQEKGHAAPTVPSALAKVGRGLPPLERSYELQKKAAKVGFDWPDASPVWEKIEEESGELRDAISAGDATAVEEEMGDLLFSLVNLSRLLKVDPAVALHRCNVKFERRFREVERRLIAEGSSPAEAGLARMDALWDQVKSEEEQSTSK